MIRFSPILHQYFINIFMIPFSISIFLKDFDNRYLISIYRTGLSPTGVKLNLKLEFLKGGSPKQCHLNFCSLYLLFGFNIRFLSLPIVVSSFLLCKNGHPLSLPSSPSTSTASGTSSPVTPGLFSSSSFGKSSSCNSIPANSTVWF